MQLPYSQSRSRAFIPTHVLPPVISSRLRDARLPAAKSATKRAATRFAPHIPRALVAPTAQHQAAQRHQCSAPLPCSVCVRIARPTRANRLANAALVDKPAAQRLHVHAFAMATAMSTALHRLLRQVYRAVRRFAPKCYTTTNLSAVCAIPASRCQVHDAVTPFGITRLHALTMTICLALPSIPVTSASTCEPCRALQCSAYHRAQ